MGREGRNGGQGNCVKVGGRKRREEKHDKKKYDMIRYYAEKRKRKSEVVTPQQAEARKPQTGP